MEVGTREVALKPDVDGRSVVIAPGVRVLYPVPTSEAATRIGRANPRRDTRAEVRLRSALHRRGLRFRKDHPVAVAASRPIRVDVAFTRAHVAVFVDGCFWHSCPQHLHVPKRNADYWVPKLRANVERDRRVDRLLGEHGWTVVRVWEHEDPECAADRVEHIVRAPALES